MLRQPLRLKPTDPTPRALCWLARGRGRLPRLGAGHQRLPGLAEADPTGPGRHGHVLAPRVGRESVARRTLAGGRAIVSPGEKWSVGAAWGGLGRWGGISLWTEFPLLVGFFPVKNGGKGGWSFLIHIPGSLDDQPT